MSNLCESLTLSGKPCRSFKLKGEKFCRVHNKNKPTSIVHCLPTISIKSFEFQNQESENCKFRNIYGEYCCKNEKCNLSYCKEHNDMFINYSITLKKMMNEMIFSQEQLGIKLSEYIDMFIQLVEFMVVYKYYNVNFSMYKIMKIAYKKTDQLIDSLVKRNVGINFSLVNFSFTLYIKKMEDVKKKILSLDIEKQIEKAKSELISNSVKIQKISEIRIKNKNELFAPICKGVDSIILSFISQPQHSI